MAQSPIVKLTTRQIRAGVLPPIETGQEKACLEEHFNRARRNGRYVELDVTITPPLSAVMLETNTDNRPISESVVARYAADMRSGRWLENGEALKFSMAGSLNDGQHRLYASFAYDVLFVSDIVFGLTRESRLTVDQGRKRTASDILKISTGQKYPNAIAGALRVLLSISGKTNKPSAIEVADALNQYPGLDEGAPISYKLYSTLKLPVPSQSIALYYLFKQRDEAANQSFWERLVEGIDFASSDDPIFKLRKRLVNMSINNRKPPPNEVLALVIKAFNAFRTNKPIKGELRWRVGSGEEFPEIE